MELEQAARAVQVRGAPMTGREDSGRVAKAEPFSSSTCMRLSILVLCTTSSGISAPSSCLSAPLSSAPKAALVKASSLQGYFLKSCKRLQARNESYLSKRTPGSARARTHHQPTSYMHPFTRMQASFHTQLCTGAGPLTSLMSTKQTMSWSSVLAVKVHGSVPSGAATTGADKIFRDASVCTGHSLLAQQGVLDFSTRQRPQQTSRMDCEHF